MTRLVLEQVTDFRDFSRGADLGEILKQSQSNGCWTNGLSDVRISPDGRHIHIMLRKPKVGLMTYDKYQRPQLILSPKHLDLGLSQTSPIVDVVYLDYSRKREEGAAVLAVVFENGKAEFWTFLECKGGWHLLQTSDLCNSPRAKVVSVSSCSNFILWCEERPPSESSANNNVTRSNFRYCICKRSYEVDEGAVNLGGVKIALHNNPCYQLISTRDTVYLLPDCADNCVAPSITKFFLCWFPQHDTFRVSTTCSGSLLRKDCPLPKESDFKRLIIDCVGYLSSLNPPDIHGFSPSGCGGLLLLLSTGRVCLLQRDGVMREVYRLADNCLAGSESHSSLQLYQDTLAVTLGRTLYLIDPKCGRELEKIILRREGQLYVNQGDQQAPHLLSDAGLFVVMLRESDPPRGSDAEPRQGSSSLGAAESLRPGALLVEAVFEEACRYYQQRSLGSTQLTVDKLKKGGMFQAPTSLASILREYLHGGAGGGGHEAAEAPWGTGGGGGGGQDKLRVSLDTELKALVSLEEVKKSVVRGSREEVELLLESLVQQEVGRLLSSPELDRDALLYLNSIFSLFPRQAWKAAQSTLQLRWTGEGCLSCRAPPEVWKTLLTPLQHPSTPANLPCANGKPKHTPGLKPSRSNLKPSPSPSPPAASLTLAVFELLCRSLFLFQPSWLPRFLELAQQQQGSAGLGLTLSSSSSWSYSGAGRGAESGESVPLYKRALSVLPGTEKDQDLEVELLLVSGRPNAVLQALRILMGRQQWERVTQVAQSFCRQSPLLNKEIFSILLCEVAQHRDLDPYLELLWALCPEDLTVTSILNMVLSNIPASSSSASTPFSSSSTSAPPLSSSPCPSQSSQVTVGLLRPLLSRVLQRETKPSQKYADILQSPSFPPPTPPRQEKGPPRATTMPALQDQAQLQEPPDDLYSNMSDRPPHRTITT